MSGCERCAWHAVKRRFGRVLCQHGATTRADRRQRGAAVGASAGQHQRHRAGPQIQRHRAQEVVEWQPQRLPGLRRGKVQHAPGKRHQHARRDQVKVIGFDPHPLDRLRHNHACVPAQQFGHHAGVAGVEVLNQNERHAGAGRDRVEQALARRQPARRSANADNGKYGLAA